jgi:hypothetical protein
MRAGAGAFASSTSNQLEQDCAPTTSGAPHAGTSLGAPADYEILRRLALQVTGMVPCVTVPSRRVAQRRNRKRNQPAWQLASAETGG